MTLGIELSINMSMRGHLSVGKTVNMNEYVEMTILVNLDVTSALKKFLDGERNEFMEL